MELPVSAGELHIGTRVAEVKVVFDAESITAYEEVVPRYETIHSSIEGAHVEGFSQPFASGTMMVAYIAEKLLPPTFGDGWTRNGSLNCAFIRPILYGSEVTIAADVVARLPSGDNTLVVMKVTARLPDNSELIAAEASALARP